MNRLQLVDTAADSQPDTLVDYWRRKYDELVEETNAQTIRSLRSQLRTIKRLASEAEDGALEAILVHAGIALAIDR